MEVLAAIFLFVIVIAIFLAMITALLTFLSVILGFLGFALDAIMLSVYGLYKLIVLGFKKMGKRNEP